jgi:hypothetical protein
MTPAAPNPRISLFANIIHIISTISFPATITATRKMVAVYRGRSIVPRNTCQMLSSGWPRKGNNGVCPESRPFEPPLLNLNIGFMIDAQRRCRTGVSGSDSCMGNMESLRIGDIVKSHPVGFCRLTSQRSRGEKESVVRNRRVAFYFWE